MVQCYCGCRSVLCVWLMNAPALLLFTSWSHFFICLLFNVRMTFVSENVEWTGCWMGSSVLLVLFGCSSSPGTFVIRLQQNTPSVVTFRFVSLPLGDREGVAEGRVRWAVWCLCVSGWGGVGVGRGYFSVYFPAFRQLAHVQ